MFMLPVVGYGGMDIFWNHPLNMGKFSNISNYFLTNNISVSYMYNMGFMNFRSHYLVGKLSAVLLNKGVYHHIERLTDWNMKTEH